MTPAEHVRNAEAELMPDGGCEYTCPHAGCVHEMSHIACAQVHALLAIADYLSGIRSYTGQMAASLEQLRGQP